MSAPGPAAATESTSLNLSDYEIEFDRMFFEVPEIKNLFSKFVTYVALSGESVEFFDFVANEWPKLCDASVAPHDDIKTYASKIIDEFVREGAPKELNLPGETRADIIVRFDTLRQQQQQETAVAAWLDLFRMAKHVVLMTLTYDIFPRFVRSHMLRYHIDPMLRSSDPKTRKHALFLLRQCAVLKSQKDSERYVYYSHDEIRAERVGPKDVYFVKALLQDSHDWNLLHVAKDGKEMAYSSDKQFIKDERMHENWSCHKLSMYAPVNMYELAAACFDSTGHTVASLSVDFRQAAFIPSDAEDADSRASSVAYMIMRPPSPILQPRYVRSCVSMWLDTSEGRTRLVGVVRPCSSSALPESLDGCTSGRVLSGLCYEYVSENMTRFTYCLYANFGGFLASDIAARASKRLVSKVIKFRVYQQRKGALKAVELYRKTKTFPYCDDAIGIIATLRDYCMRRVPRELWPPFFNYDGTAPNLTDRRYAPFLFDEVERFRKGGVPVIKKNQAAAY